MFTLALTKSIRALTAITVGAVITGGVAGCSCLGALLPAAPTEPCPVGQFVDAEYGYSVNFPDGLTCLFKTPSRTGQDAHQTVRFIAKDPSAGPLCLVSVSIIPEPDEDTRGGRTLRETLAGLHSDGELRPDGSYFKQERSKVYRTLAGGPPTISARAYTKSSCNNELLLGVLESVEATR